jgi:hypothetical protein
MDKRMDRPTEEDTKREMDEIRDRVLREGFRNPETTPADTLSDAGARFFFQGDLRMMDAQRELIMEHRPEAMEGYLAGLADRGVPPDAVQKQREMIRGPEAGPAAGAEN